MFMTVMTTVCNLQARAQVRPDQTLQVESSFVTPIDGQSDRIVGGAVRGGNLFHSFQEFNVGEGRGVFFANPTGISNILSRVTGSNSSNILGQLGVLGDANLWLLNPNGFLFGPNTDLQLAGSFYASTADEIELGEQGVFSAIEPGQSQLLSVSPAASFFEQAAQQSGSIINEGNLMVDELQSVGLVGDSLIQTGSIVAPGGSVTLVANQVDLADGARVEASNFGQRDAGTVRIQASDYVLLEGENTRVASAVLPGTQGNAGVVEVVANSLTVKNGAFLSASTFGRGNAGTVKIQAVESVLLEGLDSQGRGSRAASVVGPVGQGNAGAVNIKTQSLVLKDGAQLSANAFGEGNAGTVTVRASESVLFEGEDGNQTPEGPTPSGATVTSETTSDEQGNPGEVNITTQSLVLRNGAILSASTNGGRDAGTVKIYANESVLFEGEDSLGRASRAAAARASDTSGRGNAGEVELETKSLILKDGAFLSASTFGRGNAGTVRVIANESILFEGLNNLAGSGVVSENNSRGQGNAGEVNVKTQSLVLKDGAQLSASTFGEGNAGTIFIEASTLSVVDGSKISSLTGSNSSAGAITIFVEDEISLSGENSLISVGAEEGTNGVGGNIEVSADTLTLEDQAAISASSEGEADSGNITLNLHNLLKASNSSITTSASQATGGTIGITATNTIRLDNSNILTDVRGTGDGGNIALSAGKYIIAFGDSDILAFSQDGRGGNIELNTPIFIGESFTFTPNIVNFTNLDGNGRVDINASGEISAGIITTPDNSTIEESLTELPDNLVDTNDLLANSCIVRTNNAQGNFIITGSDSLRARPGHPAAPSLPTGTVQTIPTNKNTAPVHGNPPWQIGDPIIEPESVYRLPDGKLVISRECSK
ncbi:hypothetical protein C1752_10374 [Acaryochloris thomasi RCC1774]|uniref:Filamentous haemagglutinin FhaB/tRNA nuclease CdiA-like TPS domain-containing protein n=2 Tax=Acaryochloris TaxID=155977 RepID=A0A2W1J8C7_9CYAN|nr:hypothetical protein C1752_10374 [Acaryochloris thomasi RCC1774]